MLHFKLSIVKDAFNLLLKVLSLNVEKSKNEIEDVVEICIKLFSQVPAASDCAFEIYIQNC